MVKSARHEQEQNIEIHKDGRLALKQQFFLLGSIFCIPKHIP